MSLKFNDLKSTKTVVHCPTQEEADTVDKITGLTCSQYWVYYRGEYCASLETDRYAKVDYYERHNYRIIEAKDFIEANTFPENWCIKLTKENIDIIGPFFKKKTESTVYTNGQYIGYYLKCRDIAGKHVKDGNISASIAYDFIPTGCTEITLDQFKKYVLMQDTKKKIVAYEVIKAFPSPQKEWNVGDRVIDHGKDNGLFQKAPDWPEYLKAVYEEEFVKGDWVTDDDGKKLYQYGFEKDGEHYATPNNGVSFGSDLRKATEKEIKGWKESPCINGYKAKREGDLVSFGCYKFTEENLLSYKHLLTRDGELAKITVKGTEITVEIIDKLLNLLTKK